MGGRARIRIDHITHAAADDGEIGRVQLGVDHDIAFGDAGALIEDAPFAQQMGTQEIAAVGDGRVEARHLQGRGLHFALADGQVDGVRIRPGQPGVSGNVFRRREDAGDFRDRIDAGKFAQAEQPPKGWQQPGVPGVQAETGLVEKGIATVGDAALDGHDAVAAAQPVITNIGSVSPSAGTVVAGSFVVDAAFQRGNGSQALHDRASGISALGRPIKQGLALVFDDGFQSVRRLGAARRREGIEDVAVVGGVTVHRQELAVVDVHDDDRGAVGIFGPGAARVSQLQQTGYLRLQAGVDREPQTFGDAGANFAEHAQAGSIGRDQGQASTGAPGQDVIHARLDASFADDRLGIEADGFELRDVRRVRVTDMANDMRQQRPLNVAAGRLLPEFGAAIGFHQLVVFDEDVRLNESGVYQPVRARAQVEQVRDFRQGFFQRISQDLKADVAVGDARVVREDAHHASVLIGEGVAMAVVDVGAAGHLRFENQTGAFAHFGEDISPRPSDAPAARLRVQHQVQSAIWVGEMAQVARMEGHIILQRQPALVAGQAPGPVFNALERQLIMRRLVGGAEFVQGRQLSVAEGQEAVHLGEVAILPSIEEAPRRLFSGREVGAAGGLCLHGGQGKSRLLGAPAAAGESQEGDE